MKKIAVFGANGNLGRMAVKAFDEAGWRVRAVTRDGRFGHSKGIKAIAADAMNGQQVIEASSGCDFIFNGINPLYTQWPKLCIPVARNMMAAAKTNGAVHLFPGNVYNYGTEMPATIGDSTPFNADTKKGKIRIEMETLFEKAALEEDVQTIIIRAGDFFGGTRNGGTWFDIAIVKDLEKGKMTYPGAMDLIHSWAYLPDLADTFVKLAERSESLGRFETFLFEGHAITGEQLKTALQNVVAKQLKHKNMPWGMMKLISLFSPMLKEVIEMSYLWDVAHRLDATKLAGAIAPVPNTSLEQALAQALSDLGRGSLLAETAGRPILVNA